MAEIGLKCLVSCPRLAAKQSGQAAIKRRLAGSPDQADWERRQHSDQRYLVPQLTRLRYAPATCIDDNSLTSGFVARDVNDTLRLFGPRFFVLTQPECGKCCAIVT
jgi:hypothetical protein